MGNFLRSGGILFHIIAPRREKDLIGRVNNLEYLAQRLSAEEYLVLYPCISLIELKRLDILQKDELWKTSYIKIDTDLKLSKLID